MAARSGLTLAVGGALSCALCTGCSFPSASPQRFGSPVEAVSALERVVEGRDHEGAHTLFGAEGEYLLHSGERGLDAARAERFVRLFNENHELKPLAPGVYTLEIGANAWPFPVPLVHRGDGWSFDAAAGREEIINRRIGENEFAALGAVRAIFTAQRIFAAHTAPADGSHRYAPRLVSTPGNRNGLYWPSEAGEGVESPLGPAIARAADEPFVISDTGEPEPFHGYLYHLIPNQTGPSTTDSLSAPGRYWIIAAPARWRETGIMTFASNERGWIYQKDTGGRIPEAELDALKPDPSWVRIE